ncbi:MAG: carbon storage regulator [Oceanospirillaceae bacterium]|nr:carbon storage regulator [Oceanospirillaceae bacterium]
MLVLTLYDGETVHIGDDIKIVMDRCVDDGNSTRMAIDAPAAVKLLREEFLISAETV